MCVAAIAIGATLLSAIGQYQAGQQQAAAIKAESEQNAQISEMNARNANIAAQDASNRGANDAAYVLQQGRAERARARAMGGASGFNQSSGNPLDVLGDQTAYNQLDAMTVLSNAEREAFGYKVQASDSTAAAQNSRIIGAYKAKSARQQGLFNAGSTLMSGFGKAYEMKTARGGWFQ